MPKITVTDLHPAKPLTPDLRSDIAHEWKRLADLYRLAGRPNEEVEARRRMNTTLSERVVFEPVPRIPPRRDRADEAIRALVMLGLIVVIGFLTVVWLGIE